MMNKHELTICISQNASNVSYPTSRKMECSIDNKELFNKYKAELEQHEILVFSNGETQELELNLPPTFFVSFESFLEAASRRERVPERFYLADLNCNYHSNEEDMPEIIQNYVEVARLYQLLGSISDFKASSGHSDSLVFLALGTTLKLDSRYDHNDLKSTPDLEKFTQDFLLSDIHIHQKHVIIKNALVDIFDGKTKISIKHILTAFDQIQKYVYQSYQMYVSEFSFNKIKADINKDRLNYVSQINKVLSDIQNQMLTIPAALILISGQMSLETSFSVKNISIWLGSLVFTVLLAMLIRNQKFTLNVIKLEIQQQWLEIEARHTDAYTKFKSVYDGLDSRITTQSRALKTIEVITYSGFIASTALLAYNSNMLDQAITIAICSVPILSTLVVFTILSQLPKQPELPSK